MNKIKEKIHLGKSEDNKKKIDLSKIKELMNVDIKDIKAKLLKNSNNNKKKYFNKSEKKRKVVAFDIGNTSTKIVEGIYYKENLSVSKFIRIPTPKEAISDGAIVNKEILISRLQQTLSENSISAREGICTSNSTSIINREIMIPKVEDDEIETVVRYEIQQYLPINLDDYVLQTNILGEEKFQENQKLNVRAIAYPEKMARGYYEFLELLNLKPYALDVNYNALNKLINYVDIINEYEYNPKESIVFIDMGATSLDVNIYNEGVLKFTRIIKNGGIDIDEILIQMLNISKDEVEQYKQRNINLREENLSTQNGDVVNEIDDWIDKIEKVIQFYKNKNMGIGVDKVFIYGGTSKIKGLSEYMTSKLSISVARIQSIPKIDFNYSNETYESIDSFINAIGSIIRL
ncbi:type IV pilus assembly protein PilM [Clostridium chromiireducens]|uniref:Competence protein A n=1 Tax=Clostridium chromiireducens TaxID=225345 RepID=A0A1V4IJQ8_9CLOT|nr:type IV pilus assembly protein PilM [Clostridium chromiireducens]OPJ60064.1 competence protein A [Clostridium chromiireducens]